jgi:hypothetical protein
MQSGWKTCFQRWPNELPPRGVIVTNFQEQIPFEGFLISDTMLLLDRKAPDTTGARKVLLPYEQIAALKLVDVLKAKLFEGMGFTGQLKE